MVYPFRDLLCLVFLLAASSALTSDSIFSVISPNYRIPQYYGSFDLDFFQRDIVLISNRSTFYLRQTLDYDHEHELYYMASENRSAIYEIDKQNRFKLIAGNPNKSGFRDGDLETALFNNITSIVYFKRNHYQAKKASNFTVIILKDPSNVPC